MPGMWRAATGCAPNSGRWCAGHASGLPRSTTATDADKQAWKAAAFAQMRAEYDELKAGWDGAPAFDRWFAGGANNAGIAAIGLYSDRVPQFRALLDAEGGDLPRFYAQVKLLAAMPKPEREAALAAYGPALGPKAAHPLVLKSEIR
jgi:predicted aminopeptidase